MGPTSGRKCYITPAYLAVPKNKGDEIRIGGAHKWAEMQHHPCILGGPQSQGGQNQNTWGPQVGGNATSPLHSRGSPRPGGQNPNWWGPHLCGHATSPPHSRGSPKRGGQNQNLWGPQVGGNATSPLHSWGSPKTRETNQNWWGPQVGGKATSPPHSRGSPKSRGTKSELVGPTSGRKGYITPAFSGVPKVKGDKIRIGGAHKWADMLHHPCILGDPQREGGKIRIGGAHKWAEMLHHPCILGGPQIQGRQNQNRWGPQVGGNATSPLHSWGSPKTRRTKSELVGPPSGRNCYITPAFSGIPKVKGDKIGIGGAHKWAEMLHHPGILGGPQSQGGQNQNRWGPQVGGNATSPLHSRVSPKTRWTKSELVGPTTGRKYYITPAFSEVTKNKGDKIRIGGAHKWAEMLHHPCILWGPQSQGGQNQNRWGPQVGGNATSPLHSRGSPKARGTKSE